MDDRYTTLGTQSRRTVNGPIRDVCSIIRSRVSTHGRDLNSLVVGAGKRGARAGLAFAHVVGRSLNLFLGEGDCLAARARCSFETFRAKNVDAAASTPDQSAPLKRGRSDPDRRTLHAKDVGQLFLGQSQMAALMAPSRGVEQDGAHSALDLMDCRAGYQLPRLDQQRFDTLVNRDLQIRRLHKQFAIVRGSDEGRES